MKTPKRLALALVLLTLTAALCGCNQNPSQDKLYQPLLAYFEENGYTCRLTGYEGQTAPIYQPSAWQTLILNDAEQVLVYFDESNRADYLSAGIDQETYGYSAHFGLRFVLVYSGADDGVLGALAAM